MFFLIKGVGTKKGHNILSFLARKRRKDSKFQQGVSQSWDFARERIRLARKRRKDSKFQQGVSQSWHKARERIRLFLFQQQKGYGVSQSWDFEGTQYFIFSCA